MKEFEFEIRMDNPPTKEMKEYIDSMRTVDSFDEEEYMEENATYKYVPITVDLEDLGPYNYYDEEHTIIRIKSTQSMFIARIPYKTFQGIREAVLCTQTKKIADFHIKTKK
jgi:hypothetical protein